MFPHPERVSEVLAPLQGANQCSIVSGGLRFASTTGYFLTALRAKNHILPNAHGSLTFVRTLSPLRLNFPKTSNQREDNYGASKDVR